METNDQNQPLSGAENNPATLLDMWAGLSHEERRDTFKTLSRTDAEELFLSLKPTFQAELLSEISYLEKRSWLRLLAPDDSADLIQELTGEEREQALALLDDTSRKEVVALMAYAEDAAGGRMNSRYVRLRPEMMVDEALLYLRAQARSHVETMYYGYVLDANQKILGVVSMRELLTAAPGKRVQDIMQTEVIKIPDEMDQEEVGRIFNQHDLMAIPVVNQQGQMKGIVTFDDIVKVVEEEATEDIHKLAAVEALDAPYFKIGFFEMIRKRAGWLMILFVGEMFTTTAMRHYEDAIARAVVLAIFIPLIISSGGNSGSQATSLIIRAMSLGEIRLRDWWRVFVREISSGLVLGGILGCVGLLRIALWPTRIADYGDNFMTIGLAVGCSVLGVVLWGTLIGSMLPFILRALKLDPAAASAPLVATLVDVTGIVIYFNVTHAFLGGSVI